jgi:hypothetical protein
MGFPSGTKVYLEDKTLKNIEDLKFGDKILSVKIKNLEALNHSKFYNKYLNLNNNQENVFIKTQDLVLCSATVYSILIYKSNEGSIKLNDKILLGRNLILIQNEKNSENVYLQSGDNTIYKIQNGNENSHLLLKSLAAESSNLNIDTLNDNVFIETKIDNFDLNVPPQILVSLILLDNHFLLTENFICFSPLTLDNI